MNTKYIVTLVFLLILGISKEFIILNAEVLVAICFLGLVYVVSIYLKDSIVESIEQKARSLEKELEQYFLLEKEQLFLLINYYNKQIEFLPKLESLFYFLKKLHSFFVLDVSFELRNYYVEYTKFSLFEICTIEENISKRVHDYYLQKLYLLNTHFVNLLPLFHKKFPLYLRKQYFLQNLKSFS